MTPEQLAKSGSEHAHQRALFAAINQKIRECLQFIQPSQLRLAECLRWVHAIPNGGERHAAVAGKMKAEGVKTGVADIFCPVPKKHFEQSGLNVHENEFVYCGLYVEMKKPERRNHKDGGLSDEQKLFRDFVISQGYAYCVCYTWDEAFKAILNYLGG